MKVRQGELITDIYRPVPGEVIYLQINRRDSGGDNRSRSEQSGAEMGMRMRLATFIVVGERMSRGKIACLSTCKKHAKTSMTCKNNSNT